MTYHNLAAVQDNLADLDTAAVGILAVEELLDMPLAVEHTVCFLKYEGKQRKLKRSNWFYFFSFKMHSQHHKNKMKMQS